jgi:hypothetical protein
MREAMLEFIDTLMRGWAALAFLLWLVWVWRMNLEE